MVQKNSLPGRRWIFRDKLFINVLLIRHVVSIGITSVLIPHDEWLTERISDFANVVVVFSERRAYERWDFSSDFPKGILWVEMGQYWWACQTWSSIFARVRCVPLIRVNSVLTICVSRRQMGDTSQSEIPNTFGNTNFGLGSTEKKTNISELQWRSFPRAWKVNSRTVVRWGWDQL